jgi:glycosyltransferase involved in cell wall biosynthesis
MRIVRVGGRHTFSVAAPRAFRSHFRGAFDVVVEDLNKVPLFTPMWADAPVVLLAHHLFGATAFQAASPPVAAATWLLERPIPRVYPKVPTIAVSESTRDDLVERGLPETIIEVVPNGIDLERYTPDQAAKTAHPTLLFLGRLKEYKRLDLVLKAVANLMSQGVRVHLDVAGSGDQGEAWAKLAHELGISEQVDFLGYVSEERKLQLLRSSWVHVLTSSKEGWGISNLEAAACGTPTVASDAPGLRDSVRDGETGLLVRHGSVQELTEALRRILGDDDLRGRLSRGASAFASSFSWDAAASRVERILQRVVAGPGRG